MIEEIEQAFVLQSWETGNTSGVIRFFTSKYGAISILAKGLLRKGKEDIKSTLQPGNLVRLSISKREDAEMGILREASSLQPAFTGRKSLHRFSLECLILDLAARGIDPGPQSARAMKLLLRNLVEESSAEIIASREPTDADLAMFVEIFELLGMLPVFADDLLKPWPKDQKRPQFFLLDLEAGKLFLPENAHLERHWPEFPAAGSLIVPVPSGMLRFIFDYQRGRPVSLESTPQRIQFIYALCRLIEWHDDIRLPSFVFWMDLVGKRRS